MKPQNNPFSTSNILKIPYFFSEQEWAEAIEKLVGLRYLASVVGPHGSGKTTFLEGLVQCLRRQGKIVSYYSSESQSLTLIKMINKFSSCQILIVDGFQAFNNLEKFLIVQYAKLRGKGLIISEHSPSHLPILLKTVGEIEVLNQILAGLVSPELIESFQLECYAKKIFFQEDGNIRSVLLRLYDYFGSLKVDRS